jgi:hypothetical protein
MQQSSKILHAQWQILYWIFNNYALHASWNRKRTGGISQKPRITRPTFKVAAIIKASSDLLTRRRLTTREPILLGMKSSNTKECLGLQSQVKNGTYKARSSLSQNILGYTTCPSWDNVFENLWHSPTKPKAALHLSQLWKHTIAEGFPVPHLFLRILC